MLREVPINRDSRILDVGCGNGEFLERLSRAGFRNLLGADPFISADRETPSGVRILKNHSFEHVLDPLSTLRDARDRLAPDGRCLIRLPTTSSDAWDIYREHWVQIDAPRHFVVPSRDGFAQAARRAHMTVESVSVLSERTLQARPSARGPSSFFTRQQMTAWKKQAEGANRQSGSDQVGFVLKAE